jgi:hypothetical protein
MSKKNTIQERLIEWDAKYVTRVDKLPSDSWKFHDAAQWVANDISKSENVGLNPNTWAQLERVEKIFGRRIRKRVLFNLFNFKKRL